jgi:hypothetical protein
MLRIKHRWLQWLQNVQKPLVGLFLHLFWPKTELKSLPGSFSQFFVVYARQNAPVCEQPSFGAHFHAKTQHPRVSHKRWKYCASLGGIAPFSVEVLVTWHPCGHVLAPSSDSFETSHAFGGHAVNGKTEG